MGRWSTPRSPWKPSGPTRRIGEKKGTKRSLLVDANGIPLSLVVSGAQRHDVALLEPTLDRIVVERPTPGPGAPQRLCGDKGYTGQPADAAVRARGYVPHIPQRGADVRATRPPPHARPRRWVVERTHSWLNRYRKLLVRFEKTTAGYEGLLELACALITYRQVITIHG